MKKAAPTLAEKVKKDFIEYDNKIYNRAIENAIKVVKAALEASGDYEKYTFIITTIIGGLEGIKIGAPPYKPPQPSRKI